MKLKTLRKFNKKTNHILTILFQRILSYLSSHVHTYIQHLRMAANSNHFVSPNPRESSDAFKRNRSLGTRHVGTKTVSEERWLGPGWIVIVSILSPRLLALPDCAQSRVNRAKLLRAVCFRGEFLYGVGVFASKRGVASVAKGPFGSRTDAFQPLRVPFERRVSARQDDSRGRVRSCVFRRVHQGREGV